MTPSILQNIQIFFFCLQKNLEVLGILALLICSKMHIAEKKQVNRSIKQVELDTHL